MKVSPCRDIFKRDLAHLREVVLKVLGVLQALEDELRENLYHQIDRRLVILFIRVDDELADKFHQLPLHVCLLIGLGDLVQQLLLVGEDDIHNLLGVLERLHRLLGKVDKESLLEDFGVADNFLPEFEEEDHLSGLVCLKHSQI